MKTTTRPREASLSETARLNETLINKATIGDLAGVVDTYRAGADINASYMGQSAMDYAARIGHADIVDFLVNYGAKVYPETVRMAQRGGHAEIAQKLKTVLAKERQSDREFAGVMRE